MAEYIEKSAAVKIAERYGLFYGSVLGRHSGIADCIAEEISQLPAADVIPFANEVYKWTEAKMGRLIDANEAVTAILAERDKSPETVPAAPYELGMSEPFHYGSAMRGGIRKALRCIEMSPTVDAVPVVRWENCAFSQLDGWLCGGTALMPQHQTYPNSFCECGAKMDGGGNDAAD